MEETMIINLQSSRYVWEVLENQEYSFLFKDLIIVDAGCNIGTFSLYVQPLGKNIYALDISETNIELFNKTIRENEFKNIQTFYMALAGESKMVGINKDGSAGEGGWSIRDFGHKEVEAVTIAEFMRRQRLDYIDVLKLDVEGAELDIINASDFPQGKVRTIIGELHYSDYKRGDFKNRLVALGYQFTEYPNGHFKAVL